MTERSTRSEITDDELGKMLASEVGFSGEVKCHHRLLRAGIDLRPNIFYIDVDTQKEREIDFVATVESSGRFRRRKYRHTFELVADVKTSTAPTIILSSETLDWDAGMMGVPYAVQSIFGEDQILKTAAYPNTILSKILDTGRTGRAVVKHLSSAERQTKNQFSNSFFAEAMFSTVKAAFHEWQEWQRGHWPSTVLAQDVAAIFLPVVVVDGPLKEYFFSNDRPVLQNCEFCVVRFDGENRYKSIINGDEREIKTRESPVIFVQIDCLIRFCEMLKSILVNSRVRAKFLSPVEGSSIWRV